MTSLKLLSRWGLIPWGVPQVVRMHARGRHNHTHTVTYAHLHDIQICGWTSVGVVWDVKLKYVKPTLEIDPWYCWPEWVSFQTVFLNWFSEMFDLFWISVDELKQALSIHWSITSPSNMNRQFVAICSLPPTIMKVENGSLQNSFFPFRYIIIPWHIRGTNHIWLENRDIASQPWKIPEPAPVVPYFVEAHQPSTAWKITKVAKWDMLSF